jgi:hypothetical protein
VTTEQAELELAGLLLRNRLRDETSKAGVDAVGVFATAVRCALDELTRGAHLRPRLVCKRDLGVAKSDRPDITDPEIVPGQADRGRLSHRARV